MNAVLTLIVGFAAIALGYGFYARTINKSIIQPDDKKAEQKSRKNINGFTVE